MTASTVVRPPALNRLGLLSELDRPGDVFAHLTPNWFASVMGTGIIAVAAAGLPERFRGLQAAGITAWITAVVLLVALCVATGVHWLLHPATARGHLGNVRMAPFYGAPPMAFLTVGAATLLIGRDVIGLRAAVDLDWVLWFAGTTGGLAASTVVPYQMLTRQRVTVGSAFGGWLMPVVPPLVSASTGALLIPHVGAGQARLTLLVACYVMFGLSLVASAVIIAVITTAVRRHGVGEARLIPTLWIVLGPIGQSITAANLLGGVAHLVLPARWSTTLQTFGLAYGLLLWGFALIWIAVAGAITLRTIRTGLPFSLTWWSFTFPIGTLVTGTSALAVHTGSGFFRLAAVLSFAVLVIAWFVVAARTVHGSFRGRLFLPVGGPSAVR